MRKTTSSASQRQDPLATTTEARAQQLIAKAKSLAEKKLEDGTASSALILHFLNLDTEREKLRSKEAEADIALKQAKVDAIKSAAKIESLFEDAMTMFKKYHGEDEDA